MQSSNEQKPEGDTTIQVAGHYEIKWPDSGEHKAEVTVREVELLCKYWAQQILRGYEEWAQYRAADNQEIRVDPYSWLRLSYFAELIGQDKVRTILDEVFGDFDPLASADDTTTT